MCRINYITDSHSTQEHKQPPNKNEQHNNLLNFPKKFLKNLKVEIPKLHRWKSYSISKCRSERNEAQNWIEKLTTIINLSPHSLHSFKLNNISLRTIL